MRSSVVLYIPNPVNISKGLVEPYKTFRTYLRLYGTPTNQVNQAH